MILKATLYTPSAPTISRKNQLSNIKKGLAFLRVIAEKRSPSDVAREIWRKLQTPDMIEKWQQDKQLYQFAVAAARYYENRSLS